MDTILYSGDETGKILSTPPLLQCVNTAFILPLPSLPPDSHPIIDNETGACLGYVHESAAGVWRIFDVSGQFVGMEEAPLETPLVDPYDVILIGPAIIKLLRAGVGAIARLVTGGAISGAPSAIVSRLLPALRSSLQGLSAKRLQFTETTAKHMANSARYVPIYILHLAIKYGKRMPDPQKVAGVFRYEIPMTKLIKRGPTYVRETKTLEVVVRESDWTILHFMYF